MVGSSVTTRLLKSPCQSWWQKSQWDDKRTLHTPLHTYETVIFRVVVLFAWVVLKWACQAVYCHSAGSGSGHQRGKRATSRHVGDKGRRPPGNRDQPRLAQIKGWVHLFIPFLIISICTQSQSLEFSPYCWNPDCFVSFQSGLLLLR